MSEWPEGTMLSQEQVRSLLDGLFERYIDGDPNTEGDPLRRPKKLVNRIMWNRAHLLNLEAADPVIDEPYHEAMKFQTDRPRQIWSQLKARLIENPYTVSCTSLTGKSTPASDRMEKIIHTGLQETEYRTGQNLMGDLADGAVSLCYGVLHWRRAEEFYPHEFKRRYAEFPPPEEDGDWEMTPLDDREMGLYREKKGAYDNRRQEERLRLGFPYHIETLHPSTVFELEDKSMLNGAGAVAHARRMLVMDYDRKLQEQDGIRLSLNDKDGQLRIYREADASFGSQSYQHSSEVIIVNLWTRDECYELACTSQHRALVGANWQFVKHFKHEWGMPPFAKATGFEFQDPDPVHRYQSALEGIYRLKPAYDRLMTLWMVIAEMTALPVWYLEETSTSLPKLTEDGKVMTFTRNSAAAERIPPGYSLKKMEWAIKPEFLTAIEMYLEELKRSEPSTGLASFSASTQPWTARLEQQQQSIQPKQILMNIVRCLRVCSQSIAKDIARRDEPVTMFIEDENKRSGDVVEITPKEAAKLRVWVNVDSVSAAERFSKLEMGRQMLADPMVRISRREFVEEYEGKPDATEVLLERDINAFFEDYEKPMLMQKLVASRQATDITYNPQSQQFIGADGGEMSPSQVMGAKSGTGAGSTIASSEAGVRNPGMPEMSALKAPGTVQVEGLPG